MSLLLRDFFLFFGAGAASAKVELLLERSRLLPKGWSSDNERHVTSPFASFPLTSLVAETGIPGTPFTFASLQTLSLILISPLLLLIGDDAQTLAFCDIV
eukprot:4153619-Ditylum_brightwellii.AAC.1